MQYEQRTEKLTVVSDNFIPVKPLTLADVPELSRTRLILLILNAIGFGAAVITIITILFRSTDGTERIPEQIIKLRIASFLTQFFGFGFLITYNYSYRGLQI
ncbi:unnamed protein product, partial [Rotaria sp. Silwood1]